MPEKSFRAGSFRGKEYIGQSSKLATGTARSGACFVEGRCAIGRLSFASSSRHWGGGNPLKKSVQNGYMKPTDKFVYQTPRRVAEDEIGRAPRHDTVAAVGGNDDQKTEHGRCRRHAVDHLESPSAK